MREETTTNDDAATESSSDTPVTPADAQTEPPVSMKPPTARWDLIAYIDHASLSMVRPEKKGTTLLATKKGYALLVPSADGEWVVIAQDGKVELIKCDEVDPDSPHGQFLAQTDNSPSKEGEFTLIDEVRIALGEILILFSGLEFSVSELLAKLIDTTDPNMAGQFVTDQLSLSQMTQMTRKCASYRLVHDSERLSRVNTFCKRLDAIRELRNLFTHGMWNFETRPSKDRVVSVMNTKWKENKKDGGWSRMKDREFTPENLTAIQSNIRWLVGEAVQISACLSPSTLMPNASKPDTPDEPESA